MPELFACGQDDVLGQGCPECGGWVHRERRGGFPDQHGMRYCSEDCVADFQEFVRRQTREHHVRMRALDCECEVCAAAGHPTDVERAEWAEYLATYYEGAPG